MSSPESEKDGQDPISLALERAQSEHRGVGARSASSVRSWVQPATPKLKKSSVAAVARREVQLDAELLKKNHILCGPGLEDPNISDQYRLLRTRVLQLMRAKRWHSVGITSPGAKAGKTLSSINLAISVAREGNHDVVLIDADIRKPSIAVDLGFKVENSLADYLAGNCTLDGLLISVAGVPNLTIVPGDLPRGTEPEPERLKSQLMADLLMSFTNLSRRTVVIVDMPPVLLGDDVIAVAELLDSMLIVVNEGVTNVDDLKEAAQVLADFNLMGTILNRSSMRAKDFAGYYRAGAADVPDK